MSNREDILLSFYEELREVLPERAHLLLAQLEGLWRL